MIRFLTLSLLLLLMACNHTPLSAGGPLMPKAPTEGPPEYITGWTDGCQTGMTAYSSSYLRTMYSIKVDAEAMQNVYYSKGWRLGNRYCSYYMSRYLTLGYIDNAGFEGADLRDNDTWFSLESDLEIFKGFRLPEVTFVSSTKDAAYIGVDQDIDTFMGLTGMQSIGFY